MLGFIFTNGLLSKISQGFIAKNLVKFAKIAKINPLQVPVFLRSFGSAIFNCTKTESTTYSFLLEYKYLTQIGIEIIDYSKKWWICEYEDLKKP